MFALKRSVVGKGAKLVGRLEIDGSLELHGRVEGDVHAGSIHVLPGAHVLGSIEADRVVINGTVDGPTIGKNVLLKSRARLNGDIQCGSLVIEKGATVEGRLTRGYGADRKETERLRGEIADARVSRAEAVSNREDDTRMAELAVEAEYAGKDRTKPANGKADAG